jgi:hypothetical protein
MMVMLTMNIKLLLTIIFWLLYDGDFVRVYNNNNYFTMTITWFNKYLTMAVMMVIWLY